MSAVQSTVRWLESSLQSPPEFRITFESFRSKTSLSSSFPSAPPWPWPPCWPPCWPGGYWGRPGPGPGQHIYFILWTFQIGRAAAGTEKRKICLFKTSIVCWADQDVEALKRNKNPFHDIAKSLFHCVPEIWEIKSHYEKDLVVYWILQGT